LFILYHASKLIISVTPSTFVNLVQICLPYYVCGHYLLGWKIARKSISKVLRLRLRRDEHYKSCTMEKGILPVIRNLFNKFFRKPFNGADGSCAFMALRRYLMGDTLRNSLDEADEWFSKRMSSSFDFLTVAVELDRKFFGFNVYRDDASVSRYILCSRLLIRSPDEFVQLTWIGGRSTSYFLYDLQRLDLPCSKCFPLIVSESIRNL